LAATEDDGHPALLLFKRLALRHGKRSRAAVMNLAN
jgi:hypothetical protein